MELANPLLHCRKRREDKEVDRGDSSVKNIINYIHLVHPLFINARIPEELHHHDELGKLRDLTQKNEADV